MSVFGKTLQRLREERELSREQLGIKAGLSRMQIFRLESGKQGASWQTVQALAAALGVSCEAFQDATEGKRKKK